MLKGKLTCIRPLESDDLEKLYHWYNDPDYCYWVSGCWPPVSMLRREELERIMYEEDEHRYAIIKPDGQLIGSIGFDQVNITARSARIYLGIGCQEHWGKGYSTDALTVFVRYLFNQWNFHRLSAETWQKNLRALACYQKLGFIIEGTLREAYYVDGQYYDAIILGLLKQDFNKIHQ